MTNKQRFIALRCRLFRMIRQERGQDDYCKSYEGCVEVMTEYPNYFEDNEAELGPSYVKITLHCYVLGPYRHYELEGKTMEEALDKLEETIAGWENGYDAAYEEGEA